MPTRQGRARCPGSVRGGAGAPPAGSYARRSDADGARTLPRAAVATGLFYKSLAREFRRVRAELSQDGRKLENPSSVSNYLRSTATSAVVGLTAVLLRPS